jgi:HD-GYP domain-containing protein (c-di-GMP phosphodiesterase class II)
MRAKLHYVAALIILPIYGIQVCPYIDSLKAWQIVIPMAVVLSVQYVMRGVLSQRMVANQPLEIRVARAFWLELALFACTAVTLTLYNTVIYDFPVSSGLKVMTGVMGLGFFAAVDLGLEEEMRVADAVEAGQGRFSPDDHPFSMTRRAALFATISILVLIVVFMLIVIKDLDWIIHIGDTIPLKTARTSILIEFVFVLSVILPHTLNIIRSYARNLKRTLGNQTTVMGRITLGDYDVRVPVASNDELGFIAQHTNEMAERIEEHANELARTRDVTILSLATLAETRDNETGAHILRTQRYVRILAQHLKDHPHFSHELDDDTITLMFKSAPLHDVGKVGIPDAILLKPGKLTDEEFKIMKTHAQLGADALSVAERELGSNSFLRYAREIALTHHEKWDGSGYPQGLKGTDIPMCGRLMAVADVYDALISKRVYKPAFSHEKAVGILRDGAGSHFDPDIVAAMDACEDQFKAIARQFGDQHTEAAE